LHRFIEEELPEDKCGDYYFCNSFWYTQLEGKRTRTQVKATGADGDDVVEISR
jgi:hypothetical protein